MQSQGRDTVQFGGENMENASKALIMAGSVLIGVIIISIGVLFINSTSMLSQSYDEKLEADSINGYNNKFLIYAKNNNAQDMVSLYNLIVENNIKYEGTADRQVELIVDSTKWENKTPENLVDAMKSESNYLFETVDYHSNGFVKSLNFKKQT